MIMVSYKIINCLVLSKPELCDFSLDLHRSPGDPGFAKSLDRPMGMPAVFANSPPSRSRDISPGRIAQLRINFPSEKAGPE